MATTAEEIQAGTQSAEPAVAPETPVEQPSSDDRGGGFRFPSISEAFEKLTGGDKAQDAVTEEPVEQSAPDSEQPKADQPESPTAADADPDKVSRRQKPLDLATEENKRLVAQIEENQRVEAERNRVEAEARAQLSEFLGSDEEFAQAAQTHDLVARKGRNNEFVSDDERAASERFDRLKENRRFAGTLQQRADNAAWGAIGQGFIDGAKALEGVDAQKLTQLKTFDKVFAHIYETGQQIAEAKHRDRISELEAEVETLRARAAGNARQPERGGRSDPNLPGDGRPAWNPNESASTNLRRVELIPGAASGGAS